MEEDIRQGSKWCRLMNSETETADADIETPPLPTAAVGGHRGNFDAQLGLVLVPTLFGFLLSVAAGHGPASRTKRLNSAGFYNRPVISSWHTHNVVHAGEPFRKPCGCSALPTWEYSRWEPHRRFFHIHLFKVVSDCQVQSVSAGPRGKSLEFLGQGHEVKYGEQGHPLYPGTTATNFCRPVRGCILPPLRGWSGVAFVGAAEAAPLQSCCLRGAEAPLFHGGASVFSLLARHWTLRANSGFLPVLAAGAAADGSE